MTRFHTASVGLIFWWIFLFIFFTVLQLKFNKSSFFVNGVQVCSVSDMIEFAIPLVVVPVFFIIWFRCEIGPVTFSTIFPMLVGALSFTHGHGVHLAANSLSNTCHKNDGLSSLAEGSIQMDHFAQALDWFDEFISHWLWIGGIMLFCLSILYSQAKALHRHGRVVKYFQLRWYESIACAVFGVVYGVIFWAHNIEGGTVILGLPMSLAVTWWLWARRHSLLTVSPIAVTYFVSHGVTAALLVFWFVLWGGFPEFSHLPQGSNWIASFFATAGR